MGCVLDIITFISILLLETPVLMTCHRKSREIALQSFRSKIVVDHTIRARRVVMEI